MTGKEAYDALNPKHRAVVDKLADPEKSEPKAYREVYGCSEKAAPAAVSRLLKRVKVRSALIWKRAEEARLAAEALGVPSLSLEELVGRVAEVVRAPLGEKTKVEDGQLKAITAGQLKAYLELGCKMVTAGMLDSGSQGEEHRHILPASLPRDLADQVLEAAAETNTLPGLRRPEDDDESVLVVEEDEGAVVYEHPALAAVVGSRG